MDKVPIRFVITVTDGTREWECEVQDPKIKSISWADIRDKIEADPKCPFHGQRGLTLRVKSNWQKRES